MGNDVLKTELGAGRMVFREGTLYLWTTNDSQKMLPENKAWRDLDFPLGLRPPYLPGRRTRLGH